ncbi:hypothetical protein SAMN05444349_12933 [Bacteroides faecichinchillae]|uniref:Uncharacterized protein n=1 Tax=Bacteroides faecichinchillae TaxID=871325 RepID=A0A1M5DJL7_9BACE|nr:hypothetical protein SAMN05444349_12933 [Bacteroides faecichinchillae]
MYRLLKETKKDEIKNSIKGTIKSLEILHLLVYQKQI